LKYISGGDKIKYVFGTVPSRIQDQECAGTFKPESIRLEHNDQESPSGDSVEGGCVRLASGDLTGGYKVLSAIADRCAAAEHETLIPRRFSGGIPLK